MFFTWYVKSVTCFSHVISREKQSFAVTTRERKPFEEDGKEYHFLTREEMEEEIISQR